MKKLILLIMLTVLASFGFSAVSSGMIFNYSTGTYTENATGTVLGTTTNDDTSFDGLALPFTFTYNGTAFTTFSVNPNGFLALGATVSSSYLAISGGTSNNVVAACNKDLNAQAGATLTWEIKGTAPDRYALVQWKAYRKYNAAGDNYNFQIKLYETSNKVEIVYGTMTNNAAATTVQVGLRGASSTDYNNRTTAANWAATTAGAVNTASCAVSSTVYPASGTTFAWTVAPIYPEPTNHATGFAVGTLGYTSVQLNWTGAIGAQLPGNYLIQAIKGAGTYAAVADGVPVADDAVWTDNNAAFNIAHIVGGNSYTFPGLSPNTAYTFKIWPYTNSLANSNFKTDGVVPTVSATTLNSTVSTFPTTWDFGTLPADAFPPANWNNYSGVIATPTVLGAAGTGSWVQDDWKNITTPANKAARINIYSTLNGWLVSPPIAVPANNYEVQFDVAYMAYGLSTAPATTGTDDQFAVLVGDGVTWAPANIVRQWDNAGSAYVLNNIPPAGMTVSLPLGTAGTKYIAFYGISTVSNVDNDLMVDNITVRQTPAAPIFGLTPVSVDFGTVVQGTPTAWNNSIVVTNTGGGTLNLNAGMISIIGADAAMFEFSSANLPAALGVGATVVIPVRFTATSAGTKNAILAMLYNTVYYNVGLSGTGLPAGTVPIGNGTALLQLPIYPYYGYSYSQSLFLQSEINMPSKRIEKVKYYWNGLAEGTLSNDWVVYIGHTTKTEFAATTDWVPTSGMTQVFSGTVALPAVAGWIEITLTTPFLYNNAQNLVIAVDENEPSYEPGPTNQFLCTATATNRSLRHYSDSVNADPAAPVAGSLVLGIPNVLLMFGEIPVGPPVAVILGSPAAGAVDLPKAGFPFTWAPDPASGPLSSTSFYLSTDSGNMYGQFGEIALSGINPVGHAYGTGTFSFTYGQTYYWQVVAFGSGPPAYSVVRSFVIEVDPATPISVFPYVVDFEAHADNTLPSRWTRSSLATGWKVGTSLGSTYWSVPAHTVYAAANDDAAGSAGVGSMDLLVSPNMDFSGTYLGIPILTYDSFYNGAYGQIATLEVCTNGVDWTTIKTLTAGTAWENLSQSLAAYDGMSSVQLRFHANDAAAWASGWAIDNVSIDYVNIDMMAPVVDHYPVIGWPKPTTAVVISADIYDDLTWNSGISSATLNYSINGTSQTPLAMTLVGANYQATIPGQVAGTLIAYSITAVDASAQLNTITTATWDFYVNTPVWLQYDTNTITNNLGMTASVFGIMTGFGNPFGAGNSIKINSIFARSLYATTANVHVYTYSGGVFTNVIPSFSQSFLAATDTVIPLPNCTTTAGVFYVALTDVPAGNYFALDGTQAYYPGTHYVHFAAGEITTASLGTIEGSSFPGSWLLRANVEAGLTELTAPVVTMSPAGIISWDPIPGAALYTVYGSADPYGTFTFITNLDSSYNSFDITTELTYPADMKFFVVKAGTGAKYRLVASEKITGLHPINKNAGRLQASPWVK